jgi:cytochrome c oxidase subunit III
MNPFRLLGEKGWQRTPQTAEGISVEVSQALGHPPQKTALMFLLGVVFVLFGLFITAYFIRMKLDDWRPMPESNLLWWNTALLFLGSVVLQWTHVRVKSGRDAGVKTGLLLGAVLTLGFVFGQYVVWQDMRAAGYFMANNPANAFFYVLTGVHAVHILGGLWVWTRAGLRVFSGAPAESIRLSVELCAVYWHFLLLVWLVLFALLSRT